MTSDKILKITDQVFNKKYLIFFSLFFFLFYWFGYYFGFSQISTSGEGRILYIWTILIILYDIIRKRVPITPLQVSLGCIAFAGALSFLLQDHGHGLDQLFGLLHYIMLSYVFVSYSANVSRNRSRKTIILVSMIYVYVILFFLTISLVIYLAYRKGETFLLFPDATQLMGAARNGHIRYYGIFRHPTLLASNAVLSMILGFYLVERKKMPFFVQIYSICISLYLIYLSNARSSFIELGIIAIYLLDRITHKLLPQKKAGQVFLILLLAGAISICYVFRSKIGVYLSTLLETSVNEQYSDPLTSGRIMIWKSALNAWKEKPVLGYGWLGSWAISDLLEANISDCHNNFVDLMLWTGLAGTIPYILSVFLTLRKLFDNRKRYKGDSWLTVVILTTIALSMFDIVLLDTNRLVSLIYYLCLGHLYYFRPVKNTKSAKLMSNNAKHTESQSLPKVSSD